MLIMAYVLRARLSKNATRAKHTHFRLFPAISRQAVGAALPSAV